ncbi:hypothetical protein LUZ61_000727 [Rhynchospora tenuis]|uniref:GOLD domain-containing protein n=1 Tax=Rhynchospora tenuis TaxID=198213 RepID=A0AAD5ZFP3_9POAL|nr:hypothetical protein LUZ61_000727 [Rhynchospora tenuis]
MEGIVSVLVFALLNLLALHRAGALRFEMESGQTKCITEEIKKNSMSVGKYSVVGLTSEDQRITVRVTSPYVNRVGYVGHLHYAEEVESGNFAFTAMQQGDFLACFWLSKPYHNPPIRVTIDFEWKSGVSSRDWKFVAKERHIIAMEKELMNMGDMVKSIHEEMVYLRERQDHSVEQEMQDLNRKINTRMARLSFLSLTIIASVVVLQLWYLKTFFEKTKIL